MVVHNRHMDILGSHQQMVGQMEVRRLDERSVEINCPKCGVTFTMPTGTYRHRMRNSTSKAIHCSQKCSNTKPERE